MRVLGRFIPLIYPLDFLKSHFDLAKIKEQIAMTSPHRISVRLLAATFAFCVVGAQAQMQPGVAQKTERRASPLKDRKSVV